MASVSLRFHKDNLEQAEARSNCRRAHVACALYDKNNFFLGVGVNGDPVYSSCERPAEQGNCGCVHAEIAALARRTGFPVTAYISRAPCAPCAKALIKSGVRNFVFFDLSWPWPQARKVIEDAGASWFWACDSEEMLDRHIGSNPTSAALSSLVA